MNPTSHSSTVTNERPSQVSKKIQSAQATRCEKLGEVCVDSGSLLLADPLFSDFHDPFLDNALSRQLFDHEGRPLAVVSATGLGDGVYPVFGEFEELGNCGRRVVALHVFLWPQYCFAGDPDYKKQIARQEESYLRMMNGEHELSSHRKAKTISERSKAMLDECAVEAMNALNAQRADWQVYLRLNRMITDQVPDPEQPGSMIGIVSHGQSIELQDFFPSWTNRQLCYRLTKLASAGMLIRKRTANGYRVAIRFSSASKRKTLSHVSIDHFGWLRRPIQLPLILDTEPIRKPPMAVMLPAAA